MIYHCGDVSGEVPPVLIPNTEVKLTSADNTWLATVREDRLLLHPIKILALKKAKHCPLAQSVEHSAVNRSVVSSSLSGAAKKKASIKMGAFLFVGSWRRRELNVRPSYDGQSLMWQGLRSDSVGATVRGSHLALIKKLTWIKRYKME